MKLNNMLMIRKERKRFNNAIPDLSLLFMFDYLRFSKVCCLRVLFSCAIVFLVHGLMLQCLRDGAADTLVEKICADRISGINTTVPDSNEDGLEFELANCVTCPGDVASFEPILDGTILSPPDLSGEYIQCVPGEFAWIGTGQVTLSLVLVKESNTRGFPVQEYNGTIVFENLILVSERIPDVLPFQVRIVTTETYSGSISGEVTWDGVKGGRGLLSGTVQTDADCGFGGIFNVSISPNVEVDGTVAIGLDLTTIDSLPLCPGDCSGVDPACPLSAERILPSPIYGVPKPFNVSQITGSIKGRLNATQPIETADGNEIQHATVDLFKQNSTVRPQNSDETVDEYIEFLKSEGGVVFKSVEVLPSDNGNFSFEDIPVLDSESDDIFYTIEVSNASSDVVDPDDMDMTRTLIFARNVLPNLTAEADGPFTVHEILLSPLEIISVKFEEVPTLGGPLDKNPEANGGGRRIFPGRKTADDFPRNIVSIVAQLDPPLEGVNVCFRSFDVDDPTTNSPTLDGNVGDGDDNRGRLDENGGFPAVSQPTTEGGFDGRLGEDPVDFAPEGAVVCSKTDINGRADVILAVTFAPGDNFRVVAGLDDDEVRNIGDDPAFEEDPLLAEDVETLSGFSGAFTETLYVWRRVHVEVDSMGLVSGNLVRGRIDSVKQNEKMCGFFELNPGTETTTTLLDVGQSLPDEVGRFEGGKIRIFGIGTFPVLCNTDNDLFDDDVTVEGLAARAAGRIYFLVDDDDFNLDDRERLDGDFVENVTMPDTSLIQDSDDPNLNLFAPAYVRPTFDVGDNNDFVPFRLNSYTNSDDNAAIAMELISAYDFDAVDTEADETFWTVYLFGAYQPDIEEDGDPVIETALFGAVLGRVDDLKGVGANVFVEVQKEISEAQKSITEAHEIGHLFNGEHSDGAIMNNEGESFSDITLNKIRLLDHP